MFPRLFALIWNSQCMSIGRVSKVCVPPLFETITLQSDAGTGLRFFLLYEYLLILLQNSLDGL